MSKQKDVMTYSPQRLYCMDELDVGAVSIDQVWRWRFLGSCTVAGTGECFSAMALQTITDYSECLFILFF